MGKFSDFFRMGNGIDIISGNIRGGRQTIISNGDVVFSGSNNGDFVKGDGDVRTETRKVDGFTEIVSRGTMDILVERAECTEVVVEAEHNIQPLVETFVSRGILYIDVVGSFATTRKMRITIKTPNLAALESTGSGDIEVVGLDQGEFKLTTRGSGRVEVSGLARSVEIDSTGSGDIDLSALVSDNVTVEMRGSGDVMTFCADTLRYSMTGSGDLAVRGNPRDVDGRSRGSGDFRLKR